MFDNIRPNGLPFRQWLADLIPEPNVGKLLPPEWTPFEWLSIWEKRMKSLSEINSYRELIEYIRPRPVMYLGHRSIIALDAFISGWSFAKFPGPEDGGLLQEFTKWLAKRFEIQSSQDWARIIHFYSQDDVEALDNFFDLYDRFLRERDGSTSKAPEPEQA